MSRKTRLNKLNRRLKKLPDMGVAVALLVWGLLMGSVFIFLMGYTQGPVTVEEARPVSAVMEDVRGRYGHGSVSKRNHLNTIYIRFEDHEQLSIESPVASKKLLDQLLAIEPGATFDMLVHPNSATILALEVDGAEIVNFDESVATLARENTGFFWLGVVMYVIAAYGAVAIILRLKYRRY